MGSSSSTVHAREGYTRNQPCMLCMTPESSAMRMSAPPGGCTLSVYSITAMVAAMAVARLMTPGPMTVMHHMTTATLTTWPSSRFQGLMASASGRPNSSTAMVPKLPSSRFRPFSCQLCTSGSSLTCRLTSPSRNTAANMPRKDHTTSDSATLFLCLLPSLVAQNSRNAWPALGLLMPAARLSSHVKGLAGAAGAGVDAAACCSPSFATSASTS
mmetsp:Transcript_19782/g.50215  ORF Transcript_19782/g.50215 Transcript_19782/m.50215 type:complete len:214 (+) Transcript_19782:195-836(+)